MSGGKTIRRTTPPCSPILSSQGVSCILQAGYRAKPFHLGLIGYKLLQPGLWERHEAFPHWQRVTSFRPCGSQGESDQWCCVAHSKIGVSFDLGKKNWKSLQKRTSSVHHDYHNSALNFSHKAQSEWMQEVGSWLYLLCPVAGIILGKVPFQESMNTLRRSQAENQHHSSIRRKM